MLASTRTRTLTNARRQFDDMIAEVCDDDMPTLMTVKGQPAVVLQSMEGFQRTQRMLAMLAHDLTVSLG